MRKNIVALAMMLCCVITIGTAQNKNNGLTKEELASYETEIGRMMNYLQETLNFIGDPTQTAQEKEIIFSQSYSKIFQDDKVQIEDDLDPKRSTPLSKDVQAYLKDIDFFFQKAQFTFDVQSVANLTKQDGSIYFKVTMNRQLVGVTVTNDSINEVKVRYVEINLDKANNSLKIASIYTTKINERQSLRYWWNAMPSAWKNYFGKDLKINDTIPLKSVMLVNESDFIYTYPVVTHNGTETIVTEWKEAIVREGLDNLYKQLKSLSSIQTVDVSNIKTITTLDPLSELSELQTLNITGTNVSDLSPLRNANKLKILKADHTRINDLTPLRYDIMLNELNVAYSDVQSLSVLETLNNMERLDVAHTQVNSLQAVENCPELTSLNAEGCRIGSIAALKNLTKLENLNINHTNVRDLSPLSGLSNLRSLKISNTSVSNLEPLREISELRELYCSNTSVRDLSPLTNHRRLGKIYCDNTRIDVNQASEFSKANPFTLVIYDTNALSEWWNNLPIYWKAVFSQQLNLTDDPTTEQLHEVINMTDLDLSNNPYMQNLIPVSRLTNLVHLNISNTEITRLDALYGMTNLETIDISNTYVSDLSPLANMRQLKELNLNHTPVDNLEHLTGNIHLQTVWADHTDIDQEQVNLLKRAVPEVTVVFQSDYLQAIWSYLDETWQSLLKSHIGCTHHEPTNLELQQMMDLTSFSIEDENVIQDLEPLRGMRWLTSISVPGQGIRDIQPLEGKIYLREVKLQNNPITDLSPLEYDTLITHLNIENTQVSDLSKVEKMVHLRVLNASGTLIKSLKPLSKLTELEELLINNTNVKSISPIENIPSLKLLKIYNTKVKTKTVTALQQKRFDLNIVYY